MTKTGIVEKNFPVLEMSCAGCATGVASILKSTQGVNNAEVNFANQSAWVKYDENLVQPIALQNAVRAIGYDLVIDAVDPQAVKEDAQIKQYNEIKRRTLWSFALSVPVLIMTMFFMDQSYSVYLSMVLSAPVVF